MLAPRVEASGFLVGPAVFNTDETEHLGLAGSIPVRLRRALPRPAPRRRRLRAQTPWSGPHRALRRPRPTVPA